MNANIIQKFKAEINGFEFNSENQYNEVKNAIEKIERFHNIKIKTSKAVEFVKQSLYDIAEMIYDDFISDWESKVEKAGDILLYENDFMKDLKIMEREK